MMNMRNMSIRKKEVKKRKSSSNNYTTIGYYI